MSTTQIEAAQKWSILLRSQARQSHSAQLGSSSLIDLANTLDDLLADYKALGEKCNDYDTLKQRVEELEGAAKAQQAQSKPVAVPAAKPRQQAAKEPNDAVA
jgi:hypothetical protein